MTVRFEPLTRRYHVTLLQDGRVAEERTTDNVEDVRRWVSTFERLPLFTTRELQEHTAYDVRVRGRTVAAPYLVVLAVGASLGAWQRRLHLPPMTPGRLRWLAPRRPLRDNPVLILLWIGLLVAALAAMLSLAARSSQLSLDFLSSVVLYAVSVADLTLMLALVFVLARNILKLVVERRRALPFARFRAKLVAALLGLTLIPAVLVLLVGSELIRNAASRWFSPPIDTVISSAREIASDYYAERTRAVTAHADGAGAGALDRRSRVERSRRRSAASSAPSSGQRQLSLVEVYRVTGRETPPVAAVVEAAAPSLPPGFAPAFVLASRTASGGQNWSLERLPSGGELLRGSAPIRSSPDAPPTGVVIASVYLTDELARHSARIVEAYEDYTQLHVLRQPLEGVYLSFFLGLTLLILISATWMGLFLAKRITRPVQRLAAGAREIGAGHLDHRIEPDTHDEFGALVEAFNTMASELASSQQRLDRSRLDLERKSLEADARRRYLETILERIATGVVCFDAQGHVSVVNPVARRLLALDADALGRPAATVFGRDDLRPLAALASARPGSPGRAGRSGGAGRRARRQRRRGAGGSARHRGAARGDAGPRWPRAAPARRDDHARRRRRRARERPGRRRRDAAGPGAEGRRLARRGAPARARDQEPADADPALGRAPEAALHRRARADAAAGRRVRARHRRRGRVAQVAGRRVLAVRAHAGAEGGADRPQRAARATPWRSTPAC